MAKDGRPFFIASFAGTLFLIVLFYFTGLQILLWLGAGALLVSCFVPFFFRDPERIIPAGPGLIVSPADGKVVAVQEEECEGLERRVIRISIFLSIFNVHVNRVPATARIVHIQHLKGRFFGAWRNKASLDNEQTRIDMDCGHYKIQVKQIAGFIARRIVCRLREGQSVNRGERFGLIKFGSRTDLAVPCVSRIHVKVGDVVKGGSTTLASFPD